MQYTSFNQGTHAPRFKPSLYACCAGRHRGCPTLTSSGLPSTTRTSRFRAPGASSTGSKAPKSVSISEPRPVSEERRAAVELSISRRSRNNASACSLALGSSAIRMFIEMQYGSDPVGATVCQWPAGTYSSEPVRSRRTSKVNMSELNLPLCIAATLAGGGVNSRHVALAFKVAARLILQASVAKAAVATSDLPLFAALDLNREVVVVVIVPGCDVAARLGDIQAHLNVVGVEEASCLQHQLFCSWGEAEWEVEGLPARIQVLEHALNFTVGEGRVVLSSTLSDQVLDVEAAEARLEFIK
eukprot:scaffold3836_cov417-Prasinococcus_capsulatus_cf.AAC.12